MLNWLFRKDDNRPPAKNPDDRAWPGEFPTPDGLPRPDWEAIAAWCDSNQNLRNDRWHATVVRWLSELQEAIDADMYLYDAAPFYLLGCLEKPEAISFIRTVKRLYHSICDTLPGIAEELRGHECCTIIVFDDRESYWKYARYFHPEGEFAMSGAMTVGEGLIHIIMPDTFEESKETILAHELTHFLLCHLNLPLWLNEALAVKSEQLVFNPEICSEIENGPSGWVWNEEDIHLFWSGESFRIPGDMQPASYKLASDLLYHASSDYGTLVEFITSAKCEDAGEGAALEHLGCSLGDLVSLVVRPGKWAPALETYKVDRK